MLFMLSTGYLSLSLSLSLSLCPLFLLSRSSEDEERDKVIHGESGPDEDGRPRVRAPRAVV